MSYTKTLLAGAALCALCAAPALARVAPGVHVAGIDSRLTAHFKTGGVHHNATAFTSTVTFSGSIPEASFFKVPTLLWAETWQDTATCIPPANEKGKFMKASLAGKVSTGTTTGPTSACPSSTFTFYGPVYTLKSKTATSDTFTGTIVAKKYSGYNLLLNTTTNLTITH